MKELTRLNSLMIRNIDWSVSRKQLYDVFEKFGRIRNLSYPFNNIGFNKKFAILTYVSKEAKESLTKNFQHETISLNGKELEYRELKE
ncbi:hypothetical protein A3Q56_00186 [Intoshia linei]|uniref:RRM domain-containing protein n=1 Tax=Intoshia linei TaxID=1819745 RepID=A0A177BCW8_9BILA|nr:hypothetical protein A3Q56_00186 [Intoshia linei]